MPTLYERVEYTLRFNTGEVVEILELDEERVKALRIPEVKEELRLLLALCSPVSILALEEAKRGYSHLLETELRTPPVGTMLKLDKPDCSQFRVCPIASKILCNTRAVAQNKRKSLPECWEYTCDLPGMEGVLAKDLARNIVHAWDEGMYVLLVTR